MGPGLQTLTFFFLAVTLCRLIHVKNHSTLLPFVPCKTFKKLLCTFHIYIMLQDLIGGVVYKVSFHPLRLLSNFKKY